MSGFDCFKRILIADDSSFARHAVRVTLRSVGVPEDSEYVSVEDGRAALDALKEADAKFDLVVSDMVMPRFDGRSLAKAMSDDPTLRGIPLVIVSSVINPKETQGLRDNGVLVCLRKPVTAARMSGALDQIVSGETQLQVVVEEAASQRAKEAGPEDPYRNLIGLKLAMSFAAPDVGHPPRVLVVDDSATSRKLISKVLKKIGCVPEVAEHGCDALLKMSKERYALIVMDCDMPFMGGVEATRRIRELEEGRMHTPIVAHTAAGDRDNCREAGMDGYITKGQSIALLKRELETWVRTASTAT